MKKFVVTLAAGSALVLGFGGDAHAQEDDEAYPPQAPTETVMPATPAASPSLPSTGSDGISTMTMTAGGLLVVGLGLAGVGAFRRHQDAEAS